MSVVKQMPEMIDAHHHLWAPDTDPSGVGWVWLKKTGQRQFGDPASIQRDYLLSEFVAEAAPDRLKGSVHVQVDNALPDPIAETRFVQGISDTSGFPIAIVGFSDLAAPGLESLLDRHMNFANFRGIRQILARLEDCAEVSFAPHDYLTDPAWRAGFATLGRRNLSFDLQLYPEQMEATAAFLAAHPKVPVVIDHLGSPHDLSVAGMSLWQRGMEALAALPQVHAKLSGYAMYFGANPKQGARDVTSEILRLFGARRTMFGSNFPVDKLHLSYRVALDLIAEVAASEDLPPILGGTARRFYRF